MKPPKDNNKDESIVRLDKWLWTARFFKTRSLAKKSIEQGKVFYNGQKASPSRTVQVGAELIIPQGFDQKTIIVKNLSAKRLAYEQAKLLYEETEQSLKQRETNQEKRKTEKYLRITPKPEKRPDKKARKLIKSIRRDSGD